MRRSLPSWIIPGVLVGVVLSLAVAQPPKRMEEEDPVKPPKRMEEEDGGMPKKVIRVDDPPDKPVKKPVATVLDIDLVAASRSAKHPGVRDLFGWLSVPHDVLRVPVSFRRSGIARVKPFEENITKKLETFRGSFELVAFEGDWKETQVKIPSGSIQKFVPYEAFAQELVDKFLSEKYESFTPGNEKYLSPLDKFIAAEQALSAVVRWHDAARSAQARKGADWDLVREQLRSRLLKFRLDRLNLMVEKDDWESALALAVETAQRFPASAEQQQIGEPMAKMVQKLLDVGAGTDRYKDILIKVQQLERALPSTEATSPVRKRLIDLAQPHLTTALAHKKAGRVKEAQEALKAAEVIYPLLPGLREAKQDIDEDFPILRVGVREQPVLLSPAAAITDAEKQLSETIFEGLFEPGSEADGGRYRPVLARGRPGLVALGREVAIPREACWSDGTPITSADVVSTLRLLRGNWPGRVPVWADDLLDEAVVTDPHQIKLTLRQGHIEPLSLMSFKILPQQKLAKPDDPEFARKPIGSGPFMLDPKSHSLAGRAYTSFPANPHYRNRPDRAGLPRLLEVRTFESPDPVRELIAGDLDVLTDVPSDKVSELRSKNNIVVSAPLPSRRIFMLAINHRKGSLKNADLRRALAHAIPREKILKECFRADLGDKVHQPLSGPFPLGSWACPPRKEAGTDPLYDPAAAREALTKSGQTSAKFKLIYPQDDPAVAKAIKLIEAELKAVGIEIKSEAVKLQNLHHQVIATHDYELAYFWYDYADSTCRLRPLLDSRGSGLGGPNFLGYDGAGGRLDKLCVEALNHRGFDQVQKATHNIHREFVNREMPFVPLWQLDRFVAHAKHVQPHDGMRKLDITATPAEIDPLRVFGTIQDWKLGAK